MNIPDCRSNIRRSRSFLFSRGFYLLAVLLLFTNHQAGWCGVATDGTMGAATTLGGPNYAISAGLGQHFGGNLFHSFSQFSLIAGEKAIFSGPGGTANIIARVTGGASSINGTISSTIPGADLFLVNPAGITFGPNAALDVHGSFHASTADYVALGTSGIFPSEPDASINLTVDPPTAFGFLNSPKPITINGSFLSVPQGKTVSIVAGDITMTDANLWSYGGTAALVSLASPGVVNLGNYAAAASSMGTIKVSDTRQSSAGPVYTTTGMAGQKVANIDASGPGGGRIFIRGGSFYLNNGYIFNDTYGDVPGGLTDILVTDRINVTSSYITGTGMSGTAAGAATSLTATDTLIRDSFVNTDSWSGAEGANLSIQSSGELTIDGRSWVSTDANRGAKAGNLTIDTGSMIVGSDARISSSAPVLGAGTTSGAGSLVINAARSILLLGDIRSENAEGTSGDISISTPDLYIAGTGLISSSLLANPSPQERRSGNIFINTDRITIADNGRIETRVFYSQNGSSGDIRINTGTISMTGGGAISSSIDSASGSGGNIIIDAAKSISVTSVPVNQFKETGSIASDATNGNAGHITLNAPVVDITSGGSVSTIAQGGSGKGGDITLNASDRILVDGGKWTAGGFRRSMVATNTLSAGNAGNISLTAPVITVSGNALLDSSSQAIGGSQNAGSAGNIFISANNDVNLLGSMVTTQSATSEGGNITLSTPARVFMDHAELSASATGGFGNGGNVTLNGGRVVLRSSMMTAQAEWGNGGNLDIHADLFVASSDSVISASSRFGIQGTVILDAPFTDIGAELAKPPGGFVSIDAFLPKRCMIPGEESSSTLLISGGDAPSDQTTVFPVIMNETDNDQNQSPMKIKGDQK